MALRKWVIAAACILGFGTNAQAYIYVHALALCQVVHTGGVDGIVDTHQQELEATTLPDAAGTLITMSSADIPPGSAGAHATAAFGALTANSGAEDGENPDLFPDASANGKGFAEVHDTLYVHSASLLDGTPVALNAVLNLNPFSSSTSNGENPGFWYASAYAALDAWDLHLEYASDNPTAAILFGTLHPLVGGTVSLDYKIDAHSFVAAMANATDAQVELGIAPRISVDAANPDVTMTTESGFNYGVPVPEPSRVACESVAALMGCAVLATRSARAARRA
jgi:hypothetical protein